MNRYNPAEIEPKWQQKWADDKTFHVDIDATKPKKYIIDMFPYPSGAAMHVGHVRNFTISDVLSQYYRQKGYNVMHTMGWDTFGLPAENYAIKTGTPPAETTITNIANFKHQLTMLGMSYDWSREINTSTPEYYRWTQWIFTKLFEKGLAYQAERAQWWCDQCKTVLANEQVVNGKCWRHDGPNDPLVTKRSLKQWFFKITDYADPLLEGIEDLDWPEKIKTMQRNWIGKSTGAEITFRVDSSKKKVDDESQKLVVFTTRPDTLYGATFLVLAPEHELVSDITTVDQRSAVDDYIAATSRKSEIERQENKDKTGVFTGAYAAHPLTGEKIPIWIADYVLTGYGTGAIMAVPAHDARDFEFAKKFNIPIKEVVAPDFGELLPDAVDVTGPVVVGYDPKTKEFMSLINTKNNLRWFASGGLNDGETYEQAALRELGEEAGFKKVEKLIQLGGPTYSYYFNSNKNSNRRSFSYMYLAIIDKNDQQDQSLEEHEKYRVVWSGADEIRKDLEAEQKSDGGVEHWIDCMSRVTDAAAAYDAGKEYYGPMYSGDGVLFDSGPFSGVPSAEAREQIVQHLAREGSGEEKTNYKMRDWLISRQRYWGAPIPIIHCPEHGAVAVPEDQLPVVLPKVESYAPTGEGSVLRTVPEWFKTTCPVCGGDAERETDTMDGYACSSWYFLRYIDPDNSERAWDPEKANYWLPVDYYCGGDHAVSHLLYSRFWFHFFADLGLIDQTRREPVGKLVYNGYILAHDGNKMSKSKGNVINPDDLISSGYGADSVRLFEMFIAPYEQNTNWNTNGVPGTFRFLQRLWNLTQEFIAAPDDGADNEAVLKIAHKTIKQVSRDLDRLSFNTAVASLMEAVNDLYKLKATGYTGTRSWQFAVRSLTQLIAPFAPHIAEELWQQMDGKGSVHVASWPVHDENHLVEDMLTLAVQVNGKVRAEISVATDMNEADIKELALSQDRVKDFLKDAEPKRVIYVAGRLVNVVL